MNDSPIELVLSKLSGVRPSGDTGRQWTACCPAHDDAHQSLAVTRGMDDRVLLKCYSGCATKDVVTAIGLTWKDLFPNKIERPMPVGVSVGALAFDKRLPAEFLRDVCGLRDGDTSPRKVLIPYKDEAGTVLFERERFELKAKEGSRQPRGKKLSPYGQWRLPGYRANGVLIIVEGESDSWTCWYHDYPALGLPGADAAKCLSETDLEGFASVYVWQDGKTKVSDGSGEHFVRRVYERITALKPSVTVKVVSAEDAKDPNEIRQRLGDGFKARFDELLAAAKPVSAESLVSDSSPSASFGFTDYGNAQRLVLRHGKDIRFADDLGRWYLWGGGLWKQRGVNYVVMKAKSTAKDIIKEYFTEKDTARKAAILKHATNSESGRALREMVKLAESEPGVYIESSSLDKDAFLFNVANGTIDLRTGKLSAHRREDLITKISPVKYDPDAKCPTWDKFLSRVFANDPSDPDDSGNAELISFVGRLFGYSLTGDVSEQILPILWGGGSNGKSTLLNVVKEIMGKGYSVKAPRGLLMQKQNDSHPTELTVLFGTRLVIAGESRRGQRLSEELVKELTGSEPISARYIAKDFFEFDPTHKLLLCTNHKPRIPESDDGIWRRVTLLPFKTKFWNPSKGEFGPEHLIRNNGLAKDLRAEYPGILAWLVRGCLDWQRNGLKAPVEVTKETEEYRSEEDQIAQFLKDRCSVSNRAVNTLMKDVYSTYCKWCEDDGVRALSRNAFAADLRSHGVLVKNGTSNKVTCYGLSILETQSSIDAGDAISDMLDGFANN